MTQERKIMNMTVKPGTSIDMSGGDHDNFQAAELVPCADTKGFVDRRTRRMFKAADDWDDPSTLKSKCEAYFRKVDQDNATEGALFKPYTHAALALFLDLPSRRALSALAAKGEVWANIMDWVDLKIEACMTEGVIAKGKLNGYGCGEYLKTLCGWKQETPGVNRGAHTKANILVVGNVETAKALMEGKDIQQLGEGK